MGYANYIRETSKFSIKIINIEKTGEVEIRVKHNESCRRVLTARVSIDELGKFNSKPHHYHAAKLTYLAINAKRIHENEHYKTYIEDFRPNHISIESPAGYVRISMNPFDFFNSTKRYSPCWFDDICRFEI